jgi:hypothetical protein
MVALSTFNSKTQWFCHIFSLNPALASQIASWLLLVTMAPDCLQIPSRLLPNCFQIASRLLISLIGVSRCSHNVTSTSHIAKKLTHQHFLDSVVILYRPMPLPFSDSSIQVLLVLVSNIVLADASGVVLSL